MLSAPVDHPLNLVTQSILTYGSYGIGLALFVIAAVFGKREKTPFYLLILCASAFGALAEPLYDIGFMLYFYTPGLWTTFTSYSIPQPVWAYSGYVVLYGGPAMFICRQINRGMTRSTLFKWAAVELTCSCVFEMVGINGGAYSYWGPHAFRILQYPLVIGVLETAQVICFSVAAARLREQAKSPLALLGLFVLFPCTFYFGNFGAGAPTIIAIHTDNPAPALVAFATSLSIVFAACLVWGASFLLPQAQPRRAQGWSAATA